MRDVPITMDGVKILLAIVVTIILTVVITGFVMFMRWSKKDRAQRSAVEPSELDGTLPRP